MEAAQSGRGLGIISEYLRYETENGSALVWKSSLHVGESILLMWGGLILLVADAEQQLDVRAQKGDRQPAAQLGLLDATMVGRSAVIGTGIFVLTGLAAEIAGPVPCWRSMRSWPATCALQTSSRVGKQPGRWCPHSSRKVKVTVPVWSS